MVGPGGAFEARRKIQECLYWLWLLDERGQIAGHQYRDAAFTNALFMHEALGLKPPLGL